MEIKSVMSENLIINLSKSDEGSFGFSLLGKFAGIPHVIYDVIEDSPAAESEVSESYTEKFIFSFNFLLRSKSEFSVFSVYWLITDLMVS